MNQWGKDLGTKNVTYLGDGNGEFTKELGLLADFSKVDLEDFR